MKNKDLEYIRYINNMLSKLSDSRFTLEILDGTTVIPLKNPKKISVYFNRNLKSISKVEDTKRLKNGYRLKATLTYADIDDEYKDKNKIINVSSIQICYTNKTGGKKRIWRMIKLKDKFSFNSEDKMSRAKIIELDYHEDFLSYNYFVHNKNN